jgi:hypothetical protein
MAITLSNYLKLTEDLIRNCEASEWFEQSAACQNEIDHLRGVLGQFRNFNTLEKQYNDGRKRLQSVGSHQELLAIQQELAPIRKQLDEFMRKAPRMAGAFEELMKLCLGETIIGEKIAIGELALPYEIESERRETHECLDENLSLGMRPGSGVKHKPTVIGNYIKKLFPIKTRTTIFFEEPEKYREILQSIEDVPYRKLVDQAVVTLICSALSEGVMECMETYEKSKRGKSAG